MTANPFFRLFSIFAAVFALGMTTPAFANSTKPVVKKGHHHGGKHGKDCSCDESECKDKSCAHEKKEECKHCNEHHKEHGHDKHPHDSHEG